MFQWIKRLNKVLVSFSVFYELHEPQLDVFSRKNHGLLMLLSSLFDSLAFLR